jgi:hypothetical protein
MRGGGRPVTGQAGPARKRKLCVGWGGRCFACGGPGELGPAPRRTSSPNAPARLCPLCRGRGRAMVVGLGDAQMDLRGNGGQW